MKKSHFNNFMSMLEQDPETTETAVYLFLDLTRKQQIKVIDFYEDKAMVKIQKNKRGAYAIYFGTNRQFSMLFSDYRNNGGHAFDYLGI